MSDPLRCAACDQPFGNRTALIDHERTCWKEPQEALVSSFARLFEALPVGEEMDQFERDALANTERVMLDTNALVGQYGFIPFNHKAPVFFPVDKKSVYDAAGKEIPNYLRVERTDTGDTLAVHSAKYSLVPYERHFEIFEMAIEKSGLPFKNMLIGTDMDANGARLFRQYLFPDTISEVDTSRGPRELALRICTWDSYDGSSSFIAKGGFLDFVCANECVSGEILGSFKFMHTGAIEDRVTAAAKQLTEAAAEYKRQISRMSAWSGVGLMTDQVDKIFKALPQSSDTLANYFMAEWTRQSFDTLWDASQLLTTWSTHGDNGRLPVRTRNDRQKRVSTLMEGFDWKMLEPELEPA